MSKLLLVVLVLCSLSCICVEERVAQTSEPSDANYDRWLSTFGEWGKNYDLVLQRTVYGDPIELAKPVLIKVEAGEVVSTKYLDGEPVAEEHRDKLGLTVEDLFQLIWDAESRGVDELEVRYHPAYGHPLVIGIDENRDVTHTVMAFEIVLLK